MLQFTRQKTSRSLAGITILAALAFLPRCQGVDASLGAEMRNVEIKAASVAGRSWSVAAPADGKIVQFAVTEGATVAPGQLIAVLSNPTVERDYALAKLQVTVAEANLRDTSRPAPDRANLVASRTETALETVLSNKSAKLQRYRELRRRRDVSEQELEDAENEFAWAQRDYVTHNSAASPEVNRRMLELELVKARTEEKLARERMEALRVTAPLHGTVMATHGIEGQPVYTRDPLADITDVSTIEIRGEVAPDLNQYVHSGTAVDVKVFSVPAQMFHATIDRVIPAQSVGAGASVVVRLPNDRGTIKPNTPAKIIVAF